MSKKSASQTVTRTEMTKAQWTWFQMKTHKVAYLMIAPFMIIFFLFTVIPVVASLLLSFTSFNMLEWPKFIFMDNYITLFLDDDLFVTALKNTFIFAAVTGPASYLISYIVAWFINELPPKVRAIVTLIFYAPSIAGNVYLIWGTLFSGDAYGWVNGILLDMGIIDTPILWFQNADYVMPLIIMVALWTSLGTSFLSFIAGLQGINKSLYEAGAIDGVKNRWQELWYITLPAMKPQLMFGAVMQITSAFSVSQISLDLVGFPSVNYAGHTIMTHLHDFGNLRYEMGYACTIAVFLFLLMLFCNILVQKVLRKIG